MKIEFGTTFHERLVGSAAALRFSLEFWGVSWCCGISRGITCLPCPPLRPCQSYLRKPVILKLCCAVLGLFQRDVNRGCLYLNRNWLSLLLDLRIDHTINQGNALYLLLYWIDVAWKMRKSSIDLFFPSCSTIRSWRRQFARSLVRFFSIIL